MSDDIPNDWRNDPLEDTPPVRGGFKGRTLDQVIASLPDDQQKEIYERFMEIVSKKHGGPPQQRGACRAPSPA